MGYNLSSVREGNGALGLFDLVASGSIAKRCLSAL
ncbi:hypothetical protein T4B_5894 [Trichinella pseudospiralis]|uniref:Uncharacterized protein n=1 Tax=Trichinella pseudospiralis TaxID=6337 RepID=A0A0V1GK43_TRIPS|nr:hypothetical protein T4B_5894 [Trichinella pseudospiralis]